LKAFENIFLPARSKKPRENGITMVIDSFLGLNAANDLMETAGDYIDVVKLGWGTSRLLSEEVLEKKIQLFHEHGVKVCPGGSFMELAFAQKKEKQFLEDAKKIGFDGIEVSNGIHPMTQEEKLDLINQAVSMGFCVTSEVGKKLPEEDAKLTPEERVELAEKELEAGSWKVIMEARASGKLGIFDSNGRVKEDMVKYLLDNLDSNKIIFEAPKKPQQTWLIKALGIEVNLGNIRPDDVIPLETLRVGLRGDTLAFFHLK
jgi:phosphosulfolactate synthase